MNFSPKSSANWKIVEIYASCIKASMMKQQGLVVHTLIPVDRTSEEPSGRKAEPKPHTPSGCQRISQFCYRWAS